VSSANGVRDYDDGAFASPLEVAMDARSEGVSDGER